MWSKFDDQFYMNPKIAMLSRDEQDLYIAAIIYCNGQLTDGFIPAGVLPMLAAWSKIEANAQAIASHLLDAGLWEMSTNGYQIHDFLDWNLSKADVLELKANRSEAGRRGGQASVAKRQAIASAKAQAKPKQNSTPSPSPSQGSGKCKGKQESGENAQSASLHPLAVALSDLCGMAFDANKGRLFREAKLISQIPGFDLEVMRRQYGIGGIWYLWDWRGKKGELPTPALIRETFGALKPPIPTNGNGHNGTPAPQMRTITDVNGNSMQVPA